MNKLLPTVLLTLALSACGQSGSSSAPNALATPPSKPTVLHEDPAVVAKRINAAKHAMPGYADLDPQIDKAIDNQLGSHVAFHQAITDFQSAVAANDASRVAAMVRYPITVQVDGKPVEIENSIKFKQYYGVLIPPVTAKSIADSRYSDVKIGANGLLLGDGQTFMTGHCIDAACKKMDIKISSIQTTPAK